MYKQGDKVTYIYNGKSEKGIVKMIKNEDYSWVVFKCGGNWKEYNNYTGSLTANMYLRLGWDE